MNNKPLKEKTMGREWVARRARRQVVLGVGAAALLTVLSCSPDAAFAQSKYPDRPIKIIVPFAAGGATDIIARLLSQPLGEVLGQSVVVENRPGAGSNLGASVVARAEPDGYTFLIATSGIIASPALYKTLPYDITKDLTPVAELVTTTNIFVSDPKSGMNSVADIVARGKAKPGGLNYAHPGVGTTPQLAMELFRLRAGLEVTAIPYGGAAPASQAILAGTVQLGSMALSNIHPQVKEGTLKGIAVTGATRWHDLPDIPTVQESGFADFEFETVFIMMAPAATPKDIVERVSKEAIAILRRPESAKRIKGLGYDVLARGPDALTARLAKEIPLYKDVVTKAGIPVN
jgi:tripartite-type tricarboxylate transporter receptor subunit TctC